MDVPLVRRAWWRLYWPTWAWLMLLAIALAIKNVGWDAFVWWDFSYERLRNCWGWPLPIPYWSVESRIVDSIFGLALLLGSTAKVETLCRKLKLSLCFGLAALLAVVTWAAVHFGISFMYFTGTNRADSVIWFADGILFIAVGLSSFALVDLLAVVWNRLARK